MIDPETLDGIESALSGRSPTDGARGRAAAFFDMDGTMVRGHMILDFPSHLLSVGLFGRREYEAIARMREDFLGGEVSYRRMAERLPALYAEGVEGQKEEGLSIQAERFAEGRMDQVFPYAKGLVRLMRESGRPAVAISGSPQDTVRAMARRLGMDAALGTLFEAREGRFTGNVIRNLILGETKKAVFEEMMEKLGLDASGCFGFGDTEQDISFLGGVGHPVAVNPSAGLRTKALSKGWHILETGGDVVAEVRRIEGI